MATWRKLTSAQGAGGFEFINLDNVAKMVGHEHGTVLLFVGLADHETIVKETPQKILAAEVVR